MTRKHFELIARIIKESTSYPTPELRRAVALDFASAFAAGSPGFKRDKFLTACGVKSYP